MSNLKFTLSGHSETHKVTEPAAEAKAVRALGELTFHQQTNTSTIFVPPVFGIVDFPLSNLCIHRY